MFSVISRPHPRPGRCGFPAAPRPPCRARKPHLRNPRDACSEGPAPLPGVRHPAAPGGECAVERPHRILSLATKRMEGGRRAEECLTQSPPSSPREREESGEIYKNVPNAASRTRMAWRGKESTLKTMKTASRTWKEGGKRMSSRGAGVPPAGRLGSGKQAKRPMFSVISRLRCPLQGGTIWWLGGGRGVFQ